MTLLLRLMLTLILALPLALPRAAQAQEYRIQPRDQLSIEVLEDTNLNRTVTVLPGGTINFPYAGSLRAAGQTPTSVGARIAQSLTKVMASPPTVFVSVVPREPDPILPQPEAAPATVTVYLMGEVSAPGAKAVPPGTTLLQALSQGGTLTPYAATKRIQLRRARAPGRAVILNYDALSDGAAITHDPVLSEGDVIVVPGRRLFE